MTSALNTTALRLSARAVLLSELDVAPVITISVVPAAAYAGYIECRAVDKVSTMADLQNELVAALAQVAACGLYSADASAADWRNAKRLAARMADLQNPTWRDSAGYLRDYLVESAMMRASQHVHDHEDKIRHLAGVLVEKGTLRSSDLAQLL